MWSEFVKVTGGKLADRGLAVGSAALVFWLGLAIFWIIANGGPGWLSAVTIWLGAQSTVAQIATLLAAVLTAAVPGIVVSRLTTPMLRMLEGYWPRWAGRIRNQRVEAHKRRHADDLSRWQELTKSLDRRQQLSVDESAQWSLLDLRLHRRPADPGDFMATRTGNILKAAEARPRIKYGLESAIVWPRLWLVLPDSARTELTAARGSLDLTVAGSIWAGCFAVIGFFLLGLSPSHDWLLGGFAFALGAVIAVLIVWWWVPIRAAVFGDLVECAFDLYRFGMYEHLRWPLPTQPGTEAAAGQALTAYLWRGDVDASFGFTAPKG